MVSTKAPVAVHPIPVSLPGRSGFTGAPVAKSGLPVTAKPQAVTAAPAPVKAVVAPTMKATPIKVSPIVKHGPVKPITKPKAPPVKATPKTVAPSAPAATVPSIAAAATTIANAVTPTAVADPGTVTDGGSTTLTTDPLDAAALALLGTGTNAYGSGGSDESGTVPPSSTADLEALTPTSGDTSSTGSSVGIIVIGLLLAAAVVGYLWWRSRHGAPKPG